VSPQPSLLRGFTLPESAIAHIADDFTNQLASILGASQHGQLSVTGQRITNRTIVYQTEVIGHARPEART
jgi:hypothetical protein